MGDADIVCGIRAKRRDDFVRKISSKIGNNCRRFVTGDQIVDTGCSLKAFRREILQKMPMFNGMHRFLGTLGGYAGGRIVQVPVNHRERTRGVSKYGVWNRVWVTIGDLAAVYWMRRRWLHYTAEEVEA
jgi:dolichol-phosphate mannosyltransferase